MNASTNQRNQRVEQHLRLVQPIALHYAQRSGEDKDDLLQVGCLGLIRAAGLFDGAKGVPFEAFARPHVRGAILHYLRDSRGLVKLPRRLQERAQRLNRGKDGTDQLGDDLVMALYRNQGRWWALDDQGRDTEAMVQPGDGGWSDLSQRETREQLVRQLKRLPAAEQCSIRSVVLEGLSLRQCGREQGVSAMTVQRRLRRGLQRLAATCSPLVS
jgi:RNA polymerase sigma-B factor